MPIPGKYIDSFDRLALSISDKDIFVLVSDNETYNISAKDLIQYIRSHPDLILDYVTENEFDLFVRSKLSNVDNTHDADKNVLSAAKLTTSRSINGTTFNGTYDITTDKWGRIRVLRLNGDASGSAQIDGSSDVTLNVTVSDDSHSHTSATLPSASASIKGVTKLEDSIASTSTATAAVPNSVKQAYDKAVSAENTLTQSLSAEAERAKAAEKTISDALSVEISRAANAEQILQTNINDHTSSVNTEILSLKAVDETKADTAYVTRELADRYTKSQVFTRKEVLDELEKLIGSAPETLDTFKEIADALGNDPNFAATIMNALAGKVDKADGKGLSTNDFTSDEKSKLADCDSKKHTHSNKAILDKLTQILLDNWTSAYTKSHSHDNKIVLDSVTAPLITSWNNASSHMTNSAVHVPSSGTGNEGNYLKAGAAGTTRWGTLTSQDITSALGFTPGTGTSSLSLGESSSTAYRGDRGKTAYDHSQSAHAPAAAEKNVISGIQKNGSDLAVNSTTRKVNVTVPTKVSELTNDSGYKTTDNNTTYTLTKSGANISLSGSDGSVHTVLDTSDSYVHPSSSGYKHIPSGGGSGQVLKWSSDGTAVWSAETGKAYTAGTGLTLSGTAFHHSNATTAGTAQGDASKTLTFGGTFAIPTLSYDAQGHITGKGTTTMTMPANPNTDTKNTAGSTNSTAKLFLVGAASQAANPQTYSRSQVYIGTDGCLYSNNSRVSVSVESASEPAGLISGDTWLCEY